MDPAQFVVVDTEAVAVNNLPSDDFDPSRLIISAKFQCGWYQYVHSWEFSGDGVITPRIAMGGHLTPSLPDVAHVHHMYFRLDLDIDGRFLNDLVEVVDVLVAGAADDEHLAPSLGHEVHPCRSLRSARSVEISELADVLNFEVLLGFADLAASGE